MICLKCEGEMTKTLFEGIVVDYCPDCKSFWLDKGEFESAVKGCEFDAESRAKEAVIERINEFIEIHSDNLCPKCRAGKMVKSDMFGATVEKCSSCDGVFFDRNELQICFEKANENVFLKIWRHIKEMF